MAPALSWSVVAAVLFAALLHASWNALIKAGDDQALDTALIHVLGCGVGAALVLWVGLPRREALPWIATSVVIHVGYYVTLVGAYRHGDLGFAYPLMRGTAPLLATLLSVLFLREWPTPQVALGIVLICTGIVGIAFVGRNPHPRAAVLFALANAAIIAVYTLVDGAGARAAGTAASYAVWLTFLEAVPFLCWIRWQRGREAVDYISRGWRRGLLGGAASLGAYAIVLWAMTQAPIAAVAALRETSVLFAALIGAIWLKEGFGWPRLAGAASVVAGVAALKL